MKALRTLVVAGAILWQGYSQTAKEEAEAAHDSFVQIYAHCGRNDPSTYTNMLSRGLADRVGASVVDVPPALKEIVLLQSRMLQDFAASGGTNIVDDDLKRDLRLLSKLSVRLLFWASSQSGPGASNYWAEARKSLFSRGFTNVTEDELREDPMLVFATLTRVHASLPRSCLQWPSPDTNRMQGVTGFVERHGWNMGEPEPAGLILGPGTKPLTRLPWPVIADQTFKAYTVNRWLVVLINPPTSFGSSHGGLLWSVETNPPPRSGFFRGYDWKPLGGGWYGFSYRN